MICTSVINQKEVLKHPKRYRSSSFQIQPLKLIIRDSESLQSLDLSKDFGEGLPSQFISEIQIVNNSHLRRIVLCDPQISSCGDVFPVLETLDLRNNFVSDSISPTTLFDIPTLKTNIFIG
ncbi:unnamed protein product [Lepeophtheirus salmonis]|uniref:(salmon louse) hypothetical protein n=2 Tax=Lepeophtheirus salmonis TaxID=72036 RepID=A0A7R8CFI3_LEPSM|nr:unnamed protein product [Lepeophtheirus salmonis]CAF2760625.1 unnamed protein product [Lepeophtheirus salmonis]